MTLTDLLNIKVTAEVIRARESHPDFPTFHHGISVIREEYLELEHEIYCDGRIEDVEKEAIQLMATCARLILDNPSRTTKS